MEGRAAGRPSEPPQQGPCRQSGEADDAEAQVIPLSRLRAMAEIMPVLGLSRRKTEQIVLAFDEFVARPFEVQLQRLNGRSLALRNPMIYTVRGTTATEDWIEHVLADKETSAIEGLLGTWQEEVARIASGGVKPGSGVDLQIDSSRGVSLYALQSAKNTKNSAGSHHDLDALKRAASVLRNQRRHVELFVAVLFGRQRTAPHRREPGITILASDDFWHRASGVPDFRRRLLLATRPLANLIHERSSDEVERVRREAIALFDDGEGSLKIDALANPPRGCPRSGAGMQLELFSRIR